MKRTLALLLALLMLASLAACGTDGYVRGYYLGRFSTADGESVVVLDTGDGRHGVVLDSLMSPIHPDGLLESLDSGQIDGAFLFASVEGLRRTVADPEGQKLPVHRATRLHMENEVTVDEDVFTLSDGTKLDRVHYSFPESCFYRLPDGTRLLYEQVPDLTTIADPAVRAYFEQLGLLYDLPTELERAYAIHQAYPDRTLSLQVSQEIVFTAQSADVFYYETTVAVPRDNRVHTSRTQGSAFRSDTGEVIPMETFFTCDPTALGPTLIAAAGLQDETLAAALTAAFRPDYLSFHSDSLHICFPAEVLPDGDTAHIVIIEYADLPVGLLSAEALPVDGQP